MVRMWFLLFAGLAWPTTEAYDADVIAGQVVTKMNNTASSLTQSYTLPGFTIKFPARAHATWNVHDGRSVSTGTWAKTGAATLDRSGNNLYLTLHFAAYDFRSNYTYDCTDQSSRSGTYDMSTFFTYEASIKFRITYAGPFNCVGAVYRIDLPRIANCETSLNFDGEGVNGPDDNNCAYQSWEQQQEFLTPFRNHYCGSYYDPLNKLVRQAAEAAVEGFNFCPL